MARVWGLGVQWLFQPRKPKTSITYSPYVMVYGLGFSVYLQSLCYGWGFGVLGVWVSGVWDIGLRGLRLLLQHLPDHLPQRLSDTY